MGSFFSIPSRDKRRRSNRLSKPPANNQPASLSANSPRQPSNPCSPVASTWQNPWTGASIPVASSDSEPNGRRSHSFASVSLQSDPPWIAASKTKRSNSTAKESSDIRIHSPTSSLGTSGTLSRRASFQPSRQPTFQPAFVPNELHSPWPSPGKPRRSYSVQSPPRRANSTVNASSIEEATSSNTHFLVDSQGFSLIRRRSLLTRPGIATRRSTKDAARRCPSPIKQEPAVMSTTVNEVSHPLQWHPSRRQDTDWRHPLSLSQLRPPTPNDFEYTHLGALKLGSLRVVNGSTSPCPSDRSRRNRPRSQTPDVCPDNTFHVGPSNAPGGQRHCAKPAGFVSNSADAPRDCHNDIVCGANNSGSVSSHHSDGGLQTGDRPPFGLQCLTNRSESIPSNLVVLAHSLSHDGGFDEPPVSRLSYEEPPTSASPAFGEKEHGDGWGFASDNQKNLTARFDKAVDGEVLRSRQSVAHKKVDSGYSSAASIRSLQASRAGSSLDSQTFIQRQALKYRRFTLGGNARDATGRDAEESFSFGNQCPARLRPGLQDPEMKYRPGTRGWSTSMCHESPLKPLNGRVRSLSYTGPRSSTRVESLPRYCTHLRSQESASTGMTAALKSQNATKLDISVAALCRAPLGGTLGYGLDHGRGRNSSTGPETPNKIIAGFESPSRHPAVARTGRAASEDQGVEHPRFYDQASKLRCTDSAPGTNPAIITQSTSQSARVECHVDTPRGRPRCRSIEYQRRRLSKQRKGPNTYYATASPFASRG
ncbi:hypothetical protein P170DRAFT_229994 [Aspergillus steynii IBT 23096]|uniref:Uncharacterized protein n=1 Tax=Aspergillus steynii IBT 23096 TaxID=1392250 RepID=A0A2I2G286_9EURO|nr:uncharacterized protein P170DRAFT_229994 [Aspergillus steynii IBT 23096]PLB46984.1 hypothetical protein P170DRAFT_229994 [Aspergillus steynii IBT 23096]